MDGIEFETWRGDPFGTLGRHGTEVRAFLPGAEQVDVVSRKTGAVLGRLQQKAPGFFAGPLRRGTAYRFRVQWPDGIATIDDPYGFGPILGDLDLHLFNQGRHWELAQRMGAVPMAIDGIEGVAFSVWAPNARAVSVIGDFTHWDARRLPMRLRHDAGLWELFVPGIGPGARYKFEILGCDGISRQKADPLARATEEPPATASIVATLPDFSWSDGDWLASRADRHHAGAPISVYEMHAASWMRPWDGGTHDWDQLGDLLIPYVTGLGFTHVELMPIMEHPFGGSWGYQPLSQFAPSARYGTPAQFARFVDRCHDAGLGVILDWVPAHFPNDAHGLERFDGSPLYEHADPKEGYHPDWNTLIYNLGRTEVQGMLIASALWWLETFHVDGLRVDAVASMLYRDYSRKAGEWVPNMFGGRENLESIDFLRRLNATVHERVPGALTIAEESTAWPGVTEPVERGGLGFSFKWNMGWMNDTLRYIERDPIHRAWHGNDIGFGLVYAFSEKFVLPLSHDEVVHGKGSLIAKMPGDPWQQRANLRVLLALMWTHPGKKLLFMGAELGQWEEWQHDGQLAWHLAQYPDHAGIQALVGDLNAVYRAEGALHHGDADPRSFRWLIEGGPDAIFAFCRTSEYGGAPLIVAINMTPVPHHGYRLGAPLAGRWREILNSDAERYGGGNMGNGGDVSTDAVVHHGFGQSLALTIPPLGAILLRYEGN